LNRFKLQDLDSLSNHSSDEILVTNIPIGTNINFPDPFIKFSSLKFLTDACENMTKLLNRNGTGRILIENLECVAKLTIERFRFHVFGHEIQKPRKIERWCEILFGNDWFELSLSRVSSERSHESPINRFCLEPSSSSLFSPLTRTDHSDPVEDLRNPEL
jgi:hypothetical protein